MPLYNGSRLNGTATSGLEGRVLQLLTQLQKPFVLDTFKAISVNFFNGRHTKEAEECNEDSGNVQMRKICQFFLDFLMQCNLLVISAYFTH